MFAVFVLFLLRIYAQDVAQATIPQALRVPDTQKLIFQAYGVGDQIYTCKAVEGKYAWTLKAPDAQLLDAAGRGFGRHFAGPTWEAKDGSQIVGKVGATVPSPDPGSVAWLRLEVVRHDSNGTMTPVLSVQRLNTKGGKPPETGCDDLHAGTETRAHYEADYLFYGASK